MGGGLLWTSVRKLVGHCKKQDAGLDGPVDATGLFLKYFISSSCQAEQPVLTVKDLAHHQNHHLHPSLNSGFLMTSFTTSSPSLYATKGLGLADDLQSDFCVLIHCISTA